MTKLIKNTRAQADEADRCFSRLGQTRSKRAAKPLKMLMGQTVFGLMGRKGTPPRFRLSAFWPAFADVEDGARVRVEVPVALFARFTVAGCKLHV